MVWTQELSIGNEDVDYDHNKLLDIFNDLVELIEYNKGRQEFAKILTRMTDYSLSHFKKEDEYMRKMAYPLLNEHKNYHRDYIYKVAMFNVDLLNINSPDPKEIISFLEKWWTNHILTHDDKFEKFIKEVESSSTY
ncbi:MAG: hemerythrin family protein [Lutibacter sp.]|nr:hemerythrin family protein [Lutibacter sp.]MDT8416734.1 hemerythrin family protein [Lutibacter sp.]